MVDFIVIAVVVVVIGAAVAYIIKAKRAGVKCVGCSAGSSCSCKSKESTGCDCGCGSCNATDEGAKHNLKG